MMNEENKEIRVNCEVEILDEGRVLLDEDLRNEKFARVLARFSIKGRVDTVLLKFDDGSVQLCPTDGVKYSGEYHFAKGDKVVILDTSMLANELSNAVGRIALVNNGGEHSRYVHILIDGMQQGITKNMISHYSDGHNPGDEVIVDSEEYEDNPYGILIVCDKLNGRYIVFMEKDKTITSVDESEMRFAIDEYDDDYDDDDTLDDFQGTLTVTRDGNKITVSDGRTEGVAKCNPADEFDFRYGLELAYNRMLEEKEKPFVDRIKIEDQYYFVDHNGEVGVYYYNNDDVDADLMGQGNFFETREEAENMAREIQTFLAEYKSVQAATKHYKECFNHYSDFVRGLFID